VTKIRYEVEPHREGVTTGYQVWRVADRVSSRCGNYKRKEVAEAVRRHLNSLVDEEVL
jgi:phytoene/squalene synthetase